MCILANTYAPSFTRILGVFLLVGGILQDIHLHQTAHPLVCADYWSIREFRTGLHSSSPEPPPIESCSDSLSVSSSSTSGSTPPNVSSWRPWPTFAQSVQSSLSCQAPRGDMWHCRSRWSPYTVRTVKNQDRFCAAEEKECVCVYVCERERVETQGKVY